MKMFTKPVLIALALLILIHSVLEFFSPPSEFDFTVSNYVVGLVCNFVLLAMAVCSIKLVRTNSGYDLLEPGS